MVGASYLQFSGFELLAVFAIAAGLVVLCVRAGALGDGRRVFGPDEELF